MARPRGGRSIGGWMMTPRMMESAGLIPQGSVNTDESLKQGTPNPLGVLEKMAPSDRQEMRQKLNTARRQHKNMSPETRRRTKEAGLNKEKDLASMPKTQAAVNKFFGLDGKVDSAWRRGKTAYVSKGNNVGQGKTYQEAAYNLASQLNMLPSQKSTQKPAATKAKSTKNSKAESSNQTIILPSGQKVGGTKLKTALNSLATKTEERARKARKDPSEYPPHVTESQKDAIFQRKMNLAKDIRQGKINSFAMLQQIEFELTGKSTAMLP